MNKTTNKYTPEVRERAVRMVLDGAGQHETRWSAIVAKAVTQNALRPMPVIWKFTTIRRQALDVSLEPKASN